MNAVDPTGPSVSEYPTPAAPNVRPGHPAPAPRHPYRLGAVKAGDHVTEQVYRGDFAQSEIRLVTCGGAFDKVQHYLDNVIVLAHLLCAA